jgi:hypothetical protein
MSNSLSYADQTLKFYIQKFSRKTRRENTTSKIHVAYRMEGNFNVILEELGCKEQIGFIWLRVETSVGLLRTRS